MSSNTFLIINKLAQSAIVIILLLTACRETDPPVPVGPTPSASQMAWHEMELSAFIHFSINTFTDKEWGFGDESPSLFDPTALDTEQWVLTLKSAGFKCVILTCKHHDGFCLWPTKYTEHSVKSSPYKQGDGDVVRELSDACKKHGLRFGIYLSPWDRNHSGYGTDQYIKYYRNQLSELFNNYDPIFEMWFDGANGGDGYYGGANQVRRIDGSTYYDWPTTLDLVRSYEPEVIFFGDAGPGVRWVGNERGIAGETNWNTLTPDTLFAGKAGIEDLLNSGSQDGDQWIPAEVDVSIRPGWFYHPREDSLVKSPEKLFEIYLTSVGRGSTLLLNVPPDRRGLIHPRDSTVLMDWRKMLDNTFELNLFSKAEVKTSEQRGRNFSGEKLIDSDPETYWATSEGVNSASVQIKTEQAVTVNYLAVQEFIKLGQRVREFEIEAYVNYEWKQVAAGTTIGYKRIVKIEQVTTKTFRFTFNARACPVISAIEAY
jgi:alpha-L-fucosidase